MCVGVGVGMSMCVTNRDGCTTVWRTDKLSLVQVCVWCVCACGGRVCMCACACACACVCVCVCLCVCHKTFPFVCVSQNATVALRFGGLVNFP